HREARQRPIDRFRPDCLHPLPVLISDYRDTAEVVVHKDLSWHFDSNRYCAPPRLVGQRLTVKADASSVTLYHQLQEIVRYARCWRSGQPSGAERFEQELLTQRPGAQRSQAQRRLLALLADACPLKPSKPTCGAWPTPTARCPVRSRNCSLWSANTVLKRSPP